MDFSSIRFLHIPHFEQQASQTQADSASGASTGRVEKLRQLVRAGYTSRPRKAKLQILGRCWRPEPAV